MAEDTQNDLDSISAADFDIQDLKLDDNALSSADQSKSDEDFNFDDFLEASIKDEKSSKNTEKDFSLEEAFAVDDFAENDQTISEDMATDPIENAPEDDALANAFEENVEEEPKESKEILRDEEPIISTDDEEPLSFDLKDEVSEDTEVQSHDDVEIDEGNVSLSAIGTGEIFGVEEPKNINYLRWYNADINEKMFEIAKGFDSGRFDADESCKTIHVNVGYDTYGWSVQFDDDTVMNLRDVKEYQIRNGRLPNDKGRIIYGRSSLNFSGVERIVIYESVKYFSYGI